MSVRTRVAPSPTGAPHLGTAYVAIFNLAMAKCYGGRFILRIEDTDQSRCKESSEKAIFEALRWLGIEWDEGPDVGGEFGPYRSSERLYLYKSHIQRLIDEDSAFYCFCSPERLDNIRREQQRRKETPRYDGYCLSLSLDQAQAKIASGESYVVRLRVPNDGDCIFYDGLRGNVRIPWNQVDMQILQKSDGFPTYHLAVVVDDHYMETSHVLRGEEWLNSCPKHQLLYQAFSWTEPEHFHLPLLRNPDQSKMSKRKHPTSINYYRQCGYLPEALINYLATMGWSMPDQREIFSFDEMISKFDVTRVTPRGPVFDIEKLNWMNGQYIRSLSEQEFMERFSRWALSNNKVQRTVPLVQKRTERFIDVLSQVDYLFSNRLKLDESSFAHENMTLDECKKVLDHSLRVLEIQETWDRDDLYQVLRDLSESMGMPFRNFLFPLFIAISGRRVSLPLFDSMSILGPELSRMRIRLAVEAAGGISRKLMKHLDSEWKALHKTG